MNPKRKLSEQPWWVKVLVLFATLWLAGTALGILLGLLALLGGWSL
jgi:predicted branched-subunit amino acid permease